MHSQVQQYWVPTENIDQNALCLSSTEKSFVNEDRNQRYEIAKLLRGQKVGLPNFHQIFEGWPSATSLHLDSLRVAVDEKLKRYEFCRVSSESCMLSSHLLPGLFRLENVAQN